MPVTVLRGFFPIRALITLCLFYLTVPYGQAQLPPLEHKHIELLQSGGYLIFLRHAEREEGISGIELIDLAEHIEGMDKPPEDLPGHCLTEAGRHSAKVLGQLFAKLGIRITRVYSSPICRARQTAQLAFGRVDKEVEVLSFVHHNYADAEGQERHGRRLREFMSNSLRPDGNVVMAAHGNMLSPLGLDIDKLQPLGFLILNEDLEVVALANPDVLATLIYDLEVPVDATEEEPLRK